MTADENRRIEVFERELWRIAVEHLDYGEQVQWAALAGARVAPNGWRRARAMLHFDQGGELKRTFLLTAVQRNKNPQLRLRALQEIAAARDAEAFDEAIEMIGGWPRDEKREGVKVVLQALAEKRIGRRDQANDWIWRAAEYTREVHEEYAVQRWPETKRLLGLLVNSSGGAHARNARRLVHAARQQDRRLSAALLAAALPHTAEAGEVLNGARTRMSRKPGALARELLRNFPKGGKGRRSSRRRKKKGAAPEAVPAEALAVVGTEAGGEDGAGEEAAVAAEATPAKSRRGRRRTRVDADPGTPAAEPVAEEAAGAEEAPAKPRRSRRRKPVEGDAGADAPAGDPQPGDAPAEEPPKRTRRRRAPVAAEAGADAAPAEEAAPAKPKRTRRRKPAADEPEPVAAGPAPATVTKKPKRTRRPRTTKKAVDDAAAAVPNGASPLERASERVRDAVRGDARRAQRRSRVARASVALRRTREQQLALAAVLRHRRCALELRLRLDPAARASRAGRRGRSASRW